MNWQTAYQHDQVVLLFHVLLTRTSVFRASLFFIITEQLLLIIHRHNPVSLPDYFMGIFLALILSLPVQHLWLRGAPTLKSHQEILIVIIRL